MYRKRTYLSPKGRKNKTIRNVILGLVILAILFGWYQYSRYQYSVNTAVDPLDTTKISFTIKKGETVNDIAEKLFKEDLILDTGSFKIYTRLNGYDTKVITGRFILNRSMNIPQIVESLVNRANGEIILTIPEGSTVSDIDEELVKLDLINAGEFAKAVQNFDDYDKYSFLDKTKQKELIYPLEGYLFPDTYFLDALNYYNENLIQLMLQNFENKLNSEFPNVMTDSKTTLFDKVIMASIVEKEVRTDKDIPIVAGILWKRMDSGWTIGADATLLYLKDDREIDYFDLQEETLYNTRKYQGLPPGPICNPGLASLKGTISPEESPYFFYLTTPDTGEVIYGKNNEEHNANKRKYL